MTKRFALSGAAALILAALFGSVSRPAANEPPPKPGTILTVVGTGKVGFSGDGGPATQAALNSPSDLVVDAAGNLFFSDSNNNRVRKVSPDGKITTIAGGGARLPTAAEGGPATQAHFGTLYGLAMDAAENLLVADFGSNRIWRVSPSGTLTTVAGNGKTGASGDNGPAVKASLNGPVGLAVDTTGNLFIADYFNNRVRMVNPAGTITTVAGGGNPTDGLGDGGPATQARLRLPNMAVPDQTGHLFISDVLNHRVRMVSPDGIIRTVAGGGKPADGLGDGGPATEASLNIPDGLALDAGGNLFIADNLHFRVRKVGPVGIITTAAGTGQAGSAGDGGPATEARLDAPAGLTVDRAGNLFIMDSARISSTGNSLTLRNNRIREVFGVAVPG
jgi:sugar lactone lactonase YvrE